MSSDNFLTRSNLIDSKASTKGKICAHVKQDIRKHAASIMFITKIERQKPTQVNSCHQLVVYSDTMIFLL